MDEIVRRHELHHVPHALRAALGMVADPLELRWTQVPQQAERSAAKRGKLGQERGKIGRTVAKTRRPAVLVVTDDGWHILGHHVSNTGSHYRLGIGQMVEDLEKRPGEARYPIEARAQGWILYGAAQAEIRRSGDVWLVIEVPPKGPRGVFLSVFTEQWSQAE